MGCTSSKKHTLHLNGFTMNIKREKSIRKMSTLKSQSQQDTDFTVSSEDIHEIYEFENILGVGQFGDVKLAKLIATPILEFAIKTIKKSKATRKVEDLYNELIALKQLDHPNLVRLYETYQDSGNLYAVMELCKGRTLMDYAVMRIKAPPENEIKKIMKQIFYAIKYMHSQGFAHRDLKPSNILFATEDEIKDPLIKVADFGCAKYFKTQTDKMTTLIGSPYYVAPEVLLNKYDEKCDCWSIGVIMYQIFSATLPFAGQETSELFSNIVHGNFSMEGKRWVKVSEEAKDLIRKLLTVDPDQRLNCSQALEHVWFIEETEIRRPNNEIIQKLWKYKSQNTLQNEILRVIINFLNRKELKDVIEAFEYFDKGKDGYITVEEFQSAMASMGQTISIEEIKKLMEEIKLESHSYINYSDFIAAALNQDVFSSHEKLWSAFKHFDVHDKNFITSKDLMEAMARVGKKISSEEAEKMFKECKFGEKIGYEDFVKVMKFNTQDSPTTKSLIQEKSGSSSKFFI